ncbi:MAG: DUF5017 domain-containing protein [Bacteroidetes bacterium]|jgi:hypothetical protein|nr:DUF5017 domain-containing protein [Bacteroidota bacterium]
MKKNQNIKILSILLFMGILITSCVQDDDFDVPPINMEEPDVEVNTTIGTVKEMYKGFEPVIIETGDGSSREMYLEGYVSSDDESGNIYKQLFIQDAPENPTAGVVISTHSTDLYTKFGAGQKIYFRVDGLYIGEFAGLPTIGIREGSEVGRMEIPDFENRILRSTEKVEIVPTVITMNQLGDPSKLATLIKLEGVQFTDDLIGAYYGNIDDTFSVNRFVEDCDGNRVILRNSGFSDFKNFPLPTGNGSLTALLSIFGNDSQLLIRDTDDVQMDGDRCGQGGGTNPGDGMPIPFTENFENHAAGVGENVNLPGWTNVNVNGGTRKWEVREFSSNKYAQTSAYNVNQDPYEVWLITPGVILPSGSAPKLSFETNDGHYNGDALTVKISTDFTGDVNAATWTNLNATISSGHSSGYGDSFTPSGEIDLSAYAGQTVYVAYQYLGSPNGTTTTYQIDNVKIAE